MNKERTILIIKPDAVKNKKIGEIITIIENKFEIIKIKKKKISLEKAKKFYKEHEKKTFFNNLINFLSSSDSVIILLEGINVIELTRNIIGNNNPSLSSPETIRNKYGKNIEENAVHASDSKISAIREINFFFKK